MWGPAWDSSPEAGGNVGVQVGADAVQEDGPDHLHRPDRTHYGAPVVRVVPVRLFVEGVDSVGAVWWQGGLTRDNVSQALGRDAEEMGGEVIVRLRREAVAARCFVFLETVDGLPDFMDVEGTLL